MGSGGNNRTDQEVHEELVLLFCFILRALSVFLAAAATTLLLNHLAIHLHVAVVGVFLIWTLGLYDYHVFATGERIFGSVAHYGLVWSCRVYGIEFVVISGYPVSSKS